jgi:hypothetical protein
MGCVYLLTFTSGKSYVGITSQPFAARFSHHRKRANSQGNDAGFLVHAAWRKYGEPSVTILLEADDWPSLVAVEISAIRSFGTFTPGGYNLTHGGEGSPGAICGQDKRKKLRAANLGKKDSPETVEKKRAAQRGRTCSEDARKKIGEKNRAHRLGKPLSPEVRAKLSELNKGKTHTVNAEGRARMSAAATGRPWSEARRAAYLAKKRGFTT